ncbi:uncharacterized protein LOC135374721 [Ornithodoros turicata]|uniref:uncharacterized protein LOC135374721 n=1 Tax=Ornithodoros turicata TaxID=34597 RepID=UPI00313A0838
MAGLGEACSHIGAVLFYIEAVVRHRDSLACTEKDNVWLPPSIKELECVPLSKVDFSSSASKKRQLDARCSSKATRRSSNTSLRPTQQQWKCFLKDVEISRTRPAFFALLDEHFEGFVPTAAKYKTALLTSLYKDEPVPTLDVVTSTCRKIAEDLSIQQEVLQLIEKETRAQSTTNKWFYFRAGRVTASNVKAVCHTSVDNPSRSLISRMCYPTEHRFSTAATSWGTENEERAREAYFAAAATKHNNLMLHKSGLHISSTHPFLGASPDGIISCECCGTGVLEIKCPYKGRHDTIVQYVHSSGSSLTISDDGVIHLSENHSHYYQVQLQMLVCKAKYCDYVVWTLEEAFVDRIAVNEQFCLSMLDKCSLFFERVLLPEMRYKYWTQSGDVSSVTENSSNTFCYCNGGDVGKMILCDNPLCEKKWYHFSCINLKRAPKGEWYCDSCK